MDESRHYSCSCHRGSHPLWSNRPSSKKNRRWLQQVWVVQVWPQLVGVLRQLLRCVWWFVVQAVELVG